MVPDGSLPCPQQLGSGPYPSSHESIPHFPPEFLKIIFNIIFVMTLRPSKRSVSFGVFDQRLTYAFYPTHATLPSIAIMLGEQYASWNSPLCSFLQRHVTSCLLRPNSLIIALFSNSIKLFSSMNMKSQVLLPCRTTDKNCRCVHLRWQTGRKCDKKSALCLSWCHDFICD